MTDYAGALRLAEKLVSKLQRNGVLAGVSGDLGEDLELSRRLRNKGEKTHPHIELGSYYVPRLVLAVDTGSATEESLEHIKLTANRLIATGLKGYTVTKPIGAWVNSGVGLRRLAEYNVFTPCDSEGHATALFTLTVAQGVKGKYVKYPGVPQTVEYYKRLVAQTRERGILELIRAMVYLYRASFLYEKSGVRMVPDSADVEFLLYLRRVLKGMEKGVSAVSEVADSSIGRLVRTREVVLTRLEYMFSLHTSGV